MSAADIQARVKKGLKRAVIKTGSDSSEKVYLIVKTEVGGDGTPLDSPSEVTNNVELVDAVFTQFDASLIGDGEILKSDRRLVSNSDVAISQDDIIKQGSVEYLVVSVDLKAPTSDVLVYISQLRAQ